MDTDKMTRKLLRDFPTQLIRSALAGVYISFGAILMTECASEGMPRIVCGMAFSIGLWLVVSCNGELFTGNCLLLPYMGYGLEAKTVVDGKTEDVSEFSTTSLVVRNLAITYVGNLLGVVLASAVAAPYMDANALSGIAGAKLSTGIGDVLLKAFLCNVAICLAVRVASSEDGVAGKLLACAFPVTLFVACGWEHSIADMFLVMASGADFASGAALVAAATFGNLIGGGFVALMLRASEDTMKIRQWEDMQ